MGATAAAASGRRVLRLLGTADGELAGQVSTAGELARRRAERERGARPTGLPLLDRLLPGGGLPRGELVELVGRGSSGRFAAALAALAGVTGGGEAAALVDLGDHLDPQAATDLGADLTRLLWLRPETLAQALAAAEAVLTGGFPLVVVDLGAPPIPGGRGAEASWLRLARAAQAHGAALLVSSPYRVSGTAAHTVLAGGVARGLYAGAAAPLLGGLAVRFAVEKSRGRLGGDTAAAELVLPGARTDLAAPLLPRRPPRPAPAAGAPVPGRPAAPARPGAPLPLPAAAWTVPAAVGRPGLA